MRLLLAFFLFPSIAWAQALIVCDPTNPTVPNAVSRYESTGDYNAFLGRSGFLIWDAPNVTHTPEQIAAFNALRNQLDSLQGVPQQYWVCKDTNADGLLDSVGEMTQAQKGAVDAPEQAQRQLATQLQTEEAALDALGSDWDGLTAMQKAEAFKRTWRVRALRRQLGSE